MLVHAALLLAFAGQAASGQAGGTVSVRPENLGDDERMHLLPSPTGDGDGLACANRYRGIGSEVSYSGRVSAVVPGGPADLAGMRVGDRFMNQEMFERDQYEIGRQLVLRLERDGVLIELPVRIDRICYDMDKG